MKIVLKRRKHRKGIRPVRKGTLKVNLQGLPKLDGLKFHGHISQMLINHCATKWNDDFPGFDASAAEWRRYHINFERRKKSLLHINMLQHGFIFLDSNRQADTMKLALDAINEVSPLFVGKRQSACDNCEHKSNCPFSAVPLHLLECACPIKRKFHSNMIMKAVRDEPTDTPLTQLDMANLAGKYLS